jgi:DNA-binding NarL/FixJ family response regulator
MRILLYSPVRLFGDCLATFLEAEDSVRAVQTESCVLDLDRKAMSFDANVVLVDVTAAAALEAARLVKVLSPDVATVAVAVTEVPEDILACATSGFDAYVPQSASPQEMLKIIQRAVQGETVCDPLIARLLFNELARRQPVSSGPSTDSRLTAREVDIARLLARGAANKEIAAELHLSVATIKNHVHSVLHKLQVDSRSEVAALLLENPLALRVP